MDLPTFFNLQEFSESIELGQGKFPARDLVLLKQLSSIDSHLPNRSSRPNLGYCFQNRSNDDCSARLRGHHESLQGMDT
jgi:hypothetical protein